MQRASECVSERSSPAGVQRFKDSTTRRHDGPTTHLWPKHGLPCNFRSRPIQRVQLILPRQIQVPLRALPHSPLLPQGLQLNTLRRQLRRRIPTISRPNLKRIEVLRKTRVWHQLRYRRTRSSAPALLGRDIRGDEHRAEYRKPEKSQHQKKTARTYPRQPVSVSALRTARPAAPARRSSRRPPS